MRCRACGKILKEIEETWDKKRKRLNDTCFRCIYLAGVSFTVPTKEDILQICDDLTSQEKLLEELIEVNKELFELGGGDNFVS